MRLYLGGYGHHPSGKMYEYFGNNNYRTGQQVVAPVTKRLKDGGSITYNTMFTIMRTSGGDGQVAQNEAQRLSQKGIGIKFIQGTDVLGELPSGERFKSKADWARQSEEKYQERLSQRLFSRGGNVFSDKAEQRILGG